MNEMTISFNGQDYDAIYNNQTGYYEVEIQAPKNGGVYDADIIFEDVLQDFHHDSKAIQVLEKQQIKMEKAKVFMWIFDYKDFTVKDVIELKDYEINIDEETNANSILNILKRTNAKARDIIVVKINNENVYWGIIDNIQNEDGKFLYNFITKYITNMFNRKIKLGNEDIIRTTGIEDFIGEEITNNFIQNTDTFINLNYLEVVIKTHTPKQTSVTNVENGIYNLHTYMTNCTQNYDIVYSFSIVNKKMVIEIENKAFNKQLIDTKAQTISNYSETFETNVVSKVVVLYSKVNGNENKGEFTLYLRNDRTTTTNINDPDRADGRIETIYTENFEDANQKALDVMKANKYNHNITFDLYEKFIKVGTPIAIKTKESIIYDTYISAIKITPKKFIEYVCGNIRIKFIDKLLKERKN